MRTRQTVRGVGPDSGRATGSAVARVVVMRDIEFLTTDRPFSGAVIYRYRSGVLRKSMIAWAEAAAKRQEQDCIYLGYEDLAIDWFNENALFPGARICVPPPGSSKKAVKLLRPFLEAPPASPTLICVRADKSNDVRHPGITVVEPSPV